MWGEDGRRHSEPGHSHLETSRMELNLGKSSFLHTHTLPPSTHPSHPSRGKALTGWYLSKPVPGCQRGCPPPSRHTSSSPPPAPADAAVHTLDLLLFSVLPPPPWEAPAAWQPGSLAGTCCLLVGASMAPYLHSVSLCQGQTTQGLDASQGQPESLHPTARGVQQLIYHPPPPRPTAGCTQAKEEVRASPDGGRGGEAKTQWGGIKAKIAWRHPSSQLTQLSLPH